MSERISARRPNALGRMRKNIGGEMLAEFLGTAVLITIGCGSVAVALAGLPGSGRQSVAFGPANWLIIAWGWGLAVVFGVYIAGGISGAHINPAVTLAFAVRRGFPWRKVVPYWFAQFLGAFAGAAIVFGAYHNAINAFNSAQHISSKINSLPTFSIFATFPAQYFGGGIWGPLVDQIIGTAILVALIAAVIDNRNQAPSANLAPFVIGLIVVAIGLTFGTNAGYAINPARDFGPRLFAFFAGWGGTALPGDGTWFSNYWWIPIVGPLVGAVVGIVIYDLFIGQVLSARTEPELPGVPPETEPGRVPGSADQTVAADARADAHTNTRTGSATES